MIEVAGASDPGCVRTNNEDYYLTLPALGLYLVADGMGGAQAGEHASKLAAETVREIVAESRGADRIVLLNLQLIPLAATSEHNPAGGMPPPK